MRAAGIDTGATNIRILVSGWVDPVKVKTPETKKDYLCILDGFRSELAGSVLVDAVAGPISPDGKQVKITNQNWGIITAEEIRETSGAREVVLVNDLKAVGKGVVEIKNKEPRRIVHITGKEIPNIYEVVMAPGTGIGVGKITPDGDVLAGEGGWVLAQPVDELDYEAISGLQNKLGRYVACEDLAGNPALYNIWYALYDMVNDVVERAKDKPAKISELAGKGDEYCIKIMKSAARFLGQCAQANALSPPICDGLCIVGHFEDDRGIEGYIEALLESFYNSKHKKRLEKAHIYTVKDSDDLGAIGSYALASELATELFLTKASQISP